MAQQITIDIVAETAKLNAGINNANQQLNGLKGGLDKTQQAAVGLASAFILKEGVSFLKKANDEAIDAEKTAKLAAIAFGEGSQALKQITADADKFSKTLAVDNDDLIKLSTQLGQYLPDNAKYLSTQLINLGYDVSAVTGVDIETWTTKFSKGMADGTLKVSDLQKMVPGLTDAVYKQAEAMFKAGDSQGALNLIIAEGEKTFGNAAESQVTGSQRMTKAMGDLYEMIGTNVAPIVEKLTGFIAEMVDWVIKNKDVVVPLVAVLGTFAAAVLLLNAGLTAYNAIMAAWKVATTLATTAQTLFNAVLAANPIGLVIIAIAAIIAIIVVLVKNWDTVTEVVGKVWDIIKDFAKDAWDRIHNFVTTVVNAFNSFKDSVSKIWGAIKDNLTGLVSNILYAFEQLPSQMFNVGKNIVQGLWSGIQSISSWIRSKILDFFGGLLPSWAKRALGISSPSKVFKGIGKNINAGLWQGLQNNKSNLKTDISYYFGELLPTWAKDALQIKSPSKKFEKLGIMTAAGFKRGVEKIIPTIGFIPQANPKLVPTLNKPNRVTFSTGVGPSPLNITINAGLGTDPIILGREVQKAIRSYSKVNVIA